MTLDDLLSRLHALGFVTALDSLDEITRVLVAKRVGTPGHAIEGERSLWIDDVTEVDGPSPHIQFEGGRITFEFHGGLIPGPPDSYEKQLTSIDELYEEILHLYFDDDSPMAKEPGFVRGPGRPVIQ
jgi:hypothetical protein